MFCQELFLPVRLRRIRSEDLTHQEKWLNISDEEKVKGDLWLWEFRFKKDQGIEPTADQIEAKKQELIFKLPTPEEMRKRTFRVQRFRDV